MNEVKFTDKIYSKVVVVLLRQHKIQKIKFLMSTQNV